MHNLPIIFLFKYTFLECKTTKNVFISKYFLFRFFFRNRFFLRRLFFYFFLRLFVSFFRKHFQEFFLVSFQRNIAAPVYKFFQHVKIQRNIAHKTEQPQNHYVKTERIIISAAKPFSGSVKMRPETEETGIVSIQKYRIRLLY